MGDAPQRSGGHRNGYVGQPGRALSSFKRPSGAGRRPGDQAARTLPFSRTRSNISFWKLWRENSAARSKARRCRNPRAAAEAEIETQRLRNLLLTSFSYDLRDPLRRLSRRVHELLDPASPLSDKSRQALMKEIKDEADRLEKMAADLLTVIDTEVASSPSEKP